MTLEANPVLRRLGLKETDRAVIIHTDDIGMSQASVEAFKDLWEFGLISSGAVMVPCPWFLYAADYCRNNSGTDMGVHITLNSEYGFYRWGPISAGSDSLSLRDADGYLPQTREEVTSHADVDAVRIELNAQIDKAAHFGIDISHIDTHMGTVAHARFASAYLQAALDRQIPPMILRKDKEGYLKMKMDPETAQVIAGAVHELETAGLPLQDELIGLPLNQPDDRIEQAKKALVNLKPGVTHFIIHPAKDTPEIRAITPEDWRSRVADYQAFSSEELKKFIQQSGLVIIGYKHLRDLMRAKA